MLPDATRPVPALLHAVAAEENGNTSDTLEQAHSVYKDYMEIT